MGNFARQDIFTRISALRISRTNSDGVIAHFAKALFFLLACWLSYKMSIIRVNVEDGAKIWWGFRLGLFVIPPILFFNELFVLIPIFKKIMGYIGFHSSVIYLVHNFIRWIVFPDFVYNRGHFLIVILVLLLISLCISYFVKALEKVTGYNKAIDKLLNAITKQGPGRGESSEALP